MPRREGRTLYDVVIVGAGPAGLSAALVLGRCRRRVLLCDSGTPRSWAAHRMHGFLSRDGMELPRFRSTCRKQLQRYPSVEFVPLEAVSVSGSAREHFAVCLADGSRFTSRLLLLATGVFDPDSRDSRWPAP